MPFAGAALGGIKSFMAANKTVKGGAQGVDNVLQSTQRTITKAGNCFVAGTEILTVDGIKNIEDIQVGDWVIADDPTTPGGIEAKQVLETFVRETDALVTLYVDGEVISTTGEHPFWVSDKGWVEAKDLVVGSLLQTGDGRVVDVDKIERREGKFPVYNFKVEGIPTYFVSDLGILVHNANYDEPWMPQNPNDDIDYQNLKKSYASEEQLNEPGLDIAGIAVGKIPLRIAPRLAAEYGGNPNDWVKKTSLTYTGVKDIHIETHWYENIVTGQKVEPKTINSNVRN
ncbi:polymorphic toxin-type HINT domain-containing protein [Microcoleus sp. D2_18a_D3]|uniref:polymorphic toxin-type HINT domain-containing protein n=1 Tax=Microcoleus sp. D2_18a_D3 TaxID=3055330 RepID=UPI002FD79615